MGSGPVCEGHTDRGPSAVGAHANACGCPHERPWAHMRWARVDWGLSPVLHLLLRGLPRAPMGCYAGSHGLPRTPTGCDAGSNGLSRDATWAPTDSEEIYHRFPRALRAPTRAPTRGPTSSHMDADVGAHEIFDVESHACCHMGPRTGSHTESHDISHVGSHTGSHGGSHADSPGMPRGSHVGRKGSREMPVYPYVGSHFGVSAGSHARGISRCLHTDPRGLPRGWGQG